MVLFLYLYWVVYVCLCLFMVVRFLQSKINFLKYFIITKSYYKNTLGETRTRNPQIRSLVPYPIWPQRQKTLHTGIEPVTYRLTADCSNQLS